MSLRPAGAAVEGRRLTFLDSLRGVAALAVVIYHLPLIADPPLPIPGWANLVVLNMGGGGVTLFFVVSAFSLCLTMPLHARTGAPLFSFYIKRLLRIAPLFYVVTAYWVVRSHSLGEPWPAAKPLLLNVLFLFNLSPSAADSLAFAGWTLGVEMLFYAAFPFLVRVLRGLAPRVAFLLASLAAYPVFLIVIAELPLSPAVQARYSLISLALYLPAFAAGMLAFEVYDSDRLRPGARQRGLAWSAAAAALLAFWTTGRLANVGLYATQWLCLGCAALLLGVALHGVPVAVARVARLLGRVSYSVYLLHGPLILAANPLFQSIQHLNLPVTWRFLLALATALAVIVPAAWVSARLIEQPGIALGRRLVALRSRRTPVLG